MKRGSWSLVPRERFIFPSIIKKQLSSGTCQGAHVQNSICRYHWLEDLQEPGGNYTGTEMRAVSNKWLERLQHPRGTSHAKALLRHPHPVGWEGSVAPTADVTCRANNLSILWTPLGS